MIIKNAHYYDNDFKIADGDILINGDTITKIGDGFGSEQVIDADGCVVIPGLIDAHIHGCVGVDVSNGAPSTLSRMSKYLTMNGITSYLPTAVTADKMDLEIAASSLTKLITMSGCSRVLGFRMEGPYLSPQKSGAHNKELLRLPDIAEADSINEICGNMLKVIDVAPELEGASQFIKDATAKGYIVSLAHSNADFDTAVSAYKLGATDTTHVFNAMSGISAREPGLVGAALNSDTNAFVEMICDGMHIHPTNVKMVFNQIGEDRLVLISDGIAAMGCADGQYKLGSLDVVVKDSVARTLRGSLAGSTTNLKNCMFTAVKMGIPFVSALKAATINPAKMLKIDDRYGSIAEGKIADLVIIDTDKKIKYVIVGGKLFNRGLF